MTDSSSDSYSQRDEMAAMAGELMEAKMQTAQARNQMTHMLRMGNFHLEIVPNKDIDIEKFFEKTMNNIFERFGKDAFEVKVSGMENIKPPDGGSMHG
jgi:ribosomal protein S7